MVGGRLKHSDSAELVSIVRLDDAMPWNERGLCLPVHQKRRWQETEKKNSDPIFLRTTIAGNAEKNSDPIVRTRIFS